MLNKKYPRPKSACTKCKGEIIYCSGPIKGNYWRHNNDATKCKNDKFGESIEHKTGKSLLCSYLNEHNKVSFKKKCKCCKDIEFNNNITGWKEEYRYQKELDLCIFDIMGISTIPLLGIEIMHSHRSEKTNLRNNISWVEINASEIIEKLDVKKQPSQIILEDIYCLNENIKIESPPVVLENVKKLQPQSMISESNNLFRRCQTCNKNNIGVDEPTWKNNCIKCFCNKNSDKYINYTIKEIALELNYLNKQENYSCVARQIMDQIIKGYSIDYTYSWDLEGFSELIKKPCAGLWGELIKRHKCIKCEKRSNISYGRPFCKDCFRELNNKDVSFNSEKIYIDEALKKELRMKMRWLDNIKGNCGAGAPCHFCGDDYMNLENNDYVMGYVWWFGDYKCCCTICLEKQMKDKNII